MKAGVNFRLAASALLVFFSLSSGLYGKVYSEEDVAEAIVKSAEIYKIDPKDLFVLVGIESDFVPLVITVEAEGSRVKKLERLRNLGVRVVTGGKTFHSKKAIATIYPESVDSAVFIAKALKKNGFVFDVGIMQINSCNFDLSEIDNLFDPMYNISKGAEVYRSCRKTYKKKVHQVECYNRGSGNLSRALKKGSHYYPYWKRYRRMADRYFRK